MKHLTALAGARATRVSLLALVLTTFAIQFPDAQAPMVPADPSGLWLVKDIPNGPWTFDFDADGATLNGEIVAVRESRLGIAGGKIAGSAVSFRVLSPDGQRLISFEGRISGLEISFVRKVDVVKGGGRGANDLFEADAPAKFTARKIVPVEFKDKGFTVDVTAVQEAANREALLAGLSRQIKIIDDVIVPSATREFFKSVPLVMVSPSAKYPTVGDYSYGIIHLRGTEPLGENPLVLHELLHAYHEKRLPDGSSNVEIMKLFVQASESQQFPSESKQRGNMLSNPEEYFAMMGAVYLHGKANRDPFTRDDIRIKQPDCYRWLEKEFGPR
jgi:hypothetical protein